MATSGSFSSSFGTNSGYKIVLEWARNSFDIANNKSNVTVAAYLQSTGSSYTINSSATKSGSMTINGTSYSFTFSASLSGGQKKLIYVKGVDIAHNADGTKSFSMSVSAGIEITFGSGYVANVSTSGTGTLDTLPRASSFTVNTTNATLGSTSITVTINRASSSFTHHVFVNFGSKSTYYSTSATTSCTFTPDISLASIIPNSTTGAAALYVETYNGNTKIGTASIPLTFTVPSSVVPTISSLSAEVVASGADTSYGYVRGKSKCRLRVTGATGSYGSTMKSYTITGNGGTWTSWDSTTGVLNTPGTITFTATATDSRGRTSASKTVSITVQDYASPNVSSFSAVRCNSSGSATDSGTYIKVSASYSYTSLSSKNSVSTKVEYKTAAATSWTNAGTISSGSSVTIGGGGISTASGYNVRLTVSDKFVSVTKIVTINPSFVTMDFKAGGKGIAIGKASTSDKFSVAMESEFDSLMNIKKGKYMHEVGLGGTSGYLKLANINILGQNANTPLEITITQRGYPTPSKLFIGFSNASSASGAQLTYFWKECSINARITGANGNFVLYITPTDAWDVITVTDIQYGSFHRDKISITWLSEIVSSLPSGTDAGFYSKGYNWNGRRLCVQPDGVVEVGKYMDWHDTHTSTADYDLRFMTYTDGNGCGMEFYNPSRRIFLVDGTGTTYTNGSRPVSNNANDMGAPDLRWRTIYAINAINTSDEKYKENIQYLSVVPNAKNSRSISTGVTVEDIYNFYKNDLKLAQYNYVGQDNIEYGFIAQDLVNSEAGKSILIDSEYGYMYSIGSYVSTVAGALHYEINLRDQQIEELTRRIEELEKFLNDDTK